MPHILPCPAPRVNFADSDFEVLEDGRRRRRRSSEVSIEDGSSTERRKQMPIHISEGEKAVMRKKAHECPVPKPPGIIGRVLGFQGEDCRGEQSRPRIVTQKVSKTRKDDS